MSGHPRTRARDPRLRTLEWFRTHRALVDAVLAVALWVLLSLSILLVGALDSTTAGHSPFGPVLGVFVATSLQTLPLAWRRTSPDLSFGLVLLGYLAQVAVTDTPLPSNITAPISAYAVARYSARPWVRRVALIAAVVGGVLASLDWEGYNSSDLIPQIMSAIFLAGLVLPFWLGGDLTRKRQELVSRLREQNDALRRDRDQRALLAAQDERTRIAREMHDIVAHSLSVVVVQADGAAYTASHVEAFDREDAHRSLTTIAATAREALEETRRLVGVLRTAEDEGGVPTSPTYSPIASLGDLPELVQRVAASGVDVTLDASADLSTVPREAGLAAHRIVQESLTNVLKHAGPRARVSVRVLAGDSLDIEVRDDGRGAAALDDGHGHGLIGMHERATSIGGSLVAGPAPGGGYLVTATLPLRPREES